MNLMLGLGLGLLSLSLCVPKNIPWVWVIWFHLTNNVRYSEIVSSLEEKKKKKFPAVQNQASNRQTNWMERQTPHHWDYVEVHHSSLFACNFFCSQSSINSIFVQSLLVSISIWKKRRSFVFFFSCLLATEYQVITYNVQWIWTIASRFRAWKVYANQKNWNVMCKTLLKWNLRKLIFFSRPLVAMHSMSIEKFATLKIQTIFVIQLKVFRSQYLFFPPQYSFSVSLHLIQL